MLYIHNLYKWYLCELNTFTKSFFSEITKVVRLTQISSDTIMLSKFYITERLQSVLEMLLYFKVTKKYWQTFTKALIFTVRAFGFSCWLFDIKRYLVIELSEGLIFKYSNSTKVQVRCHSVSPLPRKLKSSSLFEVVCFFFQATVYVLGRN